MRSACRLRRGMRMDWGGGGRTSLVGVGLMKR